MPAPPLRVHLSPLLIRPEELAGGVAVVIDLLRASSTIAHAIASGAAGVVPCETVAGARELAAAVPGALLAGERHALKIPEFDLGNSPGEFTRETVGGRAVVFTTTNGTLAIARCARAAKVVIGCFNNFSAAVAAGADAARAGRGVHLVCAGIAGDLCLEDTLCAGRLALAILGGGAAAAAERGGGGDPLRVALDAAERVGEDLGGLAGALRCTQGGRNLIAAGLERDIETCAEIDSRRVLPVLGPDGVIRAGA